MEALFKNAATIGRSVDADPSRAVSEPSQTT